MDIEVLFTETELEFLLEALQMHWMHFDLRGGIIQYPPGLQAKLEEALKGHRRY